jgi:glycosyltransferase involved in cell wall biosynthesis
LSAAIDVSQDAAAAAGRRLTIILPVYNEAATIAQVIDAVLGKSIAGWTRELIIIESNSTDGTRAIVQRYGTRDGVVLLLQDAPRGKGSAVRAGLAAARGDVILIQDGDLEYSVDDYDALLAPIARGEATFVLGTRHGRGKRIRVFRDQPWTAFLLNGAHWAFTLLLNVTLRTWLTDPFTMYKVFRRECLDGLVLHCDRFDFDWELLIKLTRRGHRPVEVPVQYHSRSFKQGKKIRMFRDPVTWLVAWAKYSFGPVR